MLDRHFGLYTLQYTQFPRPSTNLDLDSSNDPTSGWVDIGTLDYVGSEGFGTNFNQTWLRHRYNFDPADTATGMRLIVPGTGLGVARRLMRSNFIRWRVTWWIRTPPPIRLRSV